MDISLDNVLLRDYRPRSMLAVDENHVPRARFPVVDAHTHLGRWSARAQVGADGHAWPPASAREIVDVMDRANVATLINLDGAWGEELEANLDRYDRAHPGRFRTFCRLDWDECRNPGWSERLVASLGDSARRGAGGLKIAKDLGLSVRDERGDLIAPDDARLAPVWTAAGELGLPVLIHTADPVAFFEPADLDNERIEELLEHPTWAFGRFGQAGRQRLLEALEAIVSEHADVRFIGAHVGGLAEDLGWVGRMLGRHPNFHIDIAARLAELGRQPRAAARLARAHPDRCLFATDYAPPQDGDFEPYFRFLETEDEHFPYWREWPPSQGRWRIYGLGLEDSVLRRIYADNARALIPSLV